MQALTSRSAEAPLALITLPSPKLRRDELRVKVHAIGVNPVDWKMRGAGAFLGFMQRLLGPSGPLVVGVDFAGEVVEVGARVEGLEPGVRVVGGTDFSRKQRGSYADEVVVRADQCARLPDAVSYEAAACLPVAAVTAWTALTDHAGIGDGSRVLVLGASGGVGLFAIQLARMLGAQVVGVCSARNTVLIESLGAVALDYGAGDPLEGLLHRRATPSELGGCTALVMPAWIEHEPRLALRALNSGIPVIATEACGLPDHPLLTLVPEGDAGALKIALARHRQSPAHVRQTPA